MKDRENRCIGILQPLAPIVIIAILVGLALWGLGWEFLPEVVAIFLAILVAGILKTRSVWIAVGFGSESCIRLLVLLGADVNSRQYHGQTPLHHAMAKGRVNVVAVLIEIGADLNAKMPTGDTPLFYAARYGYSDIIEELCMWGANVNAKRINGGSSLHYAASGGHYDAISILITYQAEVNAMDDSHKTPLSDAEEGMRQEFDDIKKEEYKKCICLLKAKGGKTSFQMLNPNVK